MKVTIDFGDEIQPAVQAHLDGGASVRDYVRAAVSYFNEMLHEARGGKVSCGFGDKSRFGSYNTIVDPIERLRSAERGSL